MEVFLDVNLLLKMKNERDLTIYNLVIYQTLLSRVIHIERHNRVTMKLTTSATEFLQVDAHVCKE